MLCKVGYKWYLITDTQHASAMCRWASVPSPTALVTVFSRSLPFSAVLATVNLKIIKDDSFTELHKLQVRHLGDNHVGF
jgi:hypothetical protein